MHVLMIGDIVGKPGVDMVAQCLPALRRQQSLDLVIANAENADGGSGMNPAIYKRLKQSGVDCITSGDHVFRKRDIIKTLESQSDILRPANYPSDAPGRGWAVIQTDRGTPVAVINLIGRVFMSPVDCPFHAAKRILNEVPAEIAVRIVDFHAEATSDKQILGRMLDGRVSAVLGTHTHVPTADEQILPLGTAFQCDVGMTGPHLSILGRDIARVLSTTLTFRPNTYSVATDDVRIHGTLLDIDQSTGKARSIRRICIDEREAVRLED